MTKEEDKRRQEHVAKIERAKKRLSRSAPWQPHYKDLKKHLDKLVQDLEDYDFFRGYK